jgi:myo-inositol-1(or 4)-monophosphatase
VAPGRAEGFWEEKHQPGDNMARSVIVEEAGGHITRFDGSPINVSADQTLATNGAIHERMIESLAASVSR